MIIKNFLKVFSRESGFVALFAVLISSIVLTIAFGLVTIALKEILLSATGRESQFGFYAADSGVECAFYLDSKSKFPTSTASSLPAEAYCNGQNTVSGGGALSLPAWSVVRTSSSATTTFWFTTSNGFFGNSPSCSKVSVGKNIGGNQIDAYGYNICPYPTPTDPKIIERGIRVVY